MESLGAFFPYGYDQRKEYQATIGDPRLFEGVMTSYCSDSNSMQLYPHQRQLVHIAGYHSLVDRMLVIHEMGSGKTITSILVCEENIARGFKKALIITPSERHNSIFLGELKKVTGTKYLDTEGNLNLSKLHDNYEIKSLQTMVNEVMGLGAVEYPKEVYQEKLLAYNNHVIIIDEAHNLRVQHNDGAKVEQKSKVMISELMKLATNSKILLMTGTPMKDRWNEMGWLFNLVCGTQFQLFDQLFENDGVIIRNEEVLRNLVRGYVSFYKIDRHTVPKVYMDNQWTSSPSFQLYKCAMQGIQKRVYNSIEFQDELFQEHSALTHKFTQASIWVFPDGTYDQDAFLQNTTKTTNIYPEFNQNVVDYLRRGNFLERVSTLSCKYAEVLHILAHSPEGLTFVYNSYINAGGLYILCNLLEMAGYTRSKDASETTPGKRFILFSSESVKKSNGMEAIIQNLNHPRNATGEFVQVILGSDTVSEGYTFKNVVNTIIISPSWNFSTIDQVIARGVRIGSHQDLQRRVRYEVEARIYFLTSSLADEKMYHFCIDKEMKIVRGLQFLESVSFEAGMTYSDPKFHSVYTSGSYDVVLSLLKEKFQVQSKVQLEELVLQGGKQEDVIHSVVSIIDQNIILRDKNGVECFVRSDGDTYFLTPPSEQGRSSLIADYLDDVSLYIPYTLHDVKREAQEENRINNLEQYHSNFPLRELVRRFEILTEEDRMCVLAQALEAKWDNRMTEFYEYLLRTYESNIFFLSEEEVMIQLKYNSNPQLLYRADLRKWELVHRKEEILDYIAREWYHMHRSHEYYGIVNTAKLHSGMYVNYWINYSAPIQTSKMTYKGCMAGTGWAMKGILIEICYKYNVIPPVLLSPSMKEIQNLIYRFLLPKGVAYVPTTPMFISEDRMEDPRVIPAEEVDIVRLHSLDKLRIYQLKYYLLQRFMELGLILYTNATDMKTYNIIIDRVIKLTRQ